VKPDPLVARIRAGDKSAERELYDQNVDRVFRLAFRLAGDSDLAADYTQDTFIRVYDKLDTFRGEAALSTWITSIAYSVVFNGLRKRRRTDSREVELTEMTEQPTLAVAEPDLKARLNEAVAALPDGYRSVFILHDVEGYKHEEIGRILGIQEGTSKAQLSRARAKLRMALAPFAKEWLP